MAGHTNGPWELWLSTDARPHSIVGPASFRNEGANLARIVDVSHYGSHKDAYASEQEANARLIASAPDAHDIIMAFIDVCDDACLVESDSPHAAFADILRDAYAYRAKATQP